MNNTSEKNKTDGETISKKNKTHSFVDIIKNFISPYHVSLNRYELESASADLTALSSYHYKFKEKHLASLIIRPANTHELSLVIQKCRKHSIPVTIRSAGTSCFSSATPSKGGVIIDVRRINKIQKIDQENKTVKVGSGISWLNLIESLADLGLAPKCYPTSFKTSCVAGFIATPGKAGIGVLEYGSMKNTIISLDLVLPDGSIAKISRDSKETLSLDDIIGTYGIYGAISDVELSVTTLKTSLEIIGFGFSTIIDAVKFYSTLKNELPIKPIFLSISDQNFEKFSHISFPHQKWLVWAVFYDEPEETSQGISAVKAIALKMNAVDIENYYLKEKWRDISDAEVAIGRSSRNLIFQEYWISDERLETFIELYSKQSKKFKFRTALYVISGEKEHSRIKIFGLTDISKPREFFAVKAFLHDFSLRAFNQGDRLYTIGIVNTFYLLKYRPKEVLQRRILKDKLDPEDLFNSYRIVKAKMKFWRISLLFKTAKLLYKI